ncbi:hypothetical protein BTHE_1956 [Bifidobacterium thermophilum]|nr:hypothetical protein BTHE_1956 [Bifidobacterium thermophilum]
MVPLRAGVVTHIRLYSHRIEGAGVRFAPGAHRCGGTPVFDDGRADSVGSGDFVGSGDSSGQDVPMPGSARYIAWTERLPDPRSTGVTQCADNRFPAVVRRPGRRR